jgi:hypothetical protein
MSDLKKSKYSLTGNPKNIQMTVINVKASVLKLFSREFKNKPISSVI